MDPNIQAVLDALKGAPKIDQDPRLPDALKATFSQSNSPTSGLTYYDLEAGAKLLYPVITPLRNLTPRVSGRGGIQANWRAVTGINTTNLDVGVTAGNRGAIMNVTTEDYTASYKGIGIEDNVDFEAQYAAENFDDVRALAAQMGLEALMQKEEVVLLGGNNSLALGITPTPTVGVVGTGGTLAATQVVYCVALTLDGYRAASVTAGVRQLVSRTNADGSVDTFGGGTARKSAGATATISSGTTNSITAAVTAVRGALGYAWFWGTSGNEVLGAITTAPAYTITGAATGTQTAASVSAATDYSTNSTLFDGLLTQALKAGSGAYWRDLGGATLTADGKGGIVEIDAILKDRWDNFKLSPDTIWVSSQQAQDMGKKILEGSSTGALRFTVDMSRGAVGGGIIATEYLNKFGLGNQGRTDGAYGRGKTLSIEIHPNLPDGTILMTSKSLPYRLSGVGNVFQVRTRQEYYQIEWPLRSRKWEYGVYADEVLQHYFPASMAVLTGIGAG